MKKTNIALTEEDPMFAPQNFDGRAAAQRMIDRGTAPHLSCLETVATAIKGDIASDSPGSYPMAINGWERCPTNRQHTYTAEMTAPAFTVGYALTSTRPDGHVWINLGGDRVVSTDTPTAGRIGITTLPELRRRMGLTLLGFTDWFLGHNLVTVTAAGLGISLFAPITALEPKDDDMPKHLRAYGRNFILGPGYAHISADDSETAFMIENFGAPLELGGAFFPAGQRPANPGPPANMLNLWLRAYGVAGDFTAWGDMPDGGTLTDGAPSILTPTQLATFAGGLAGALKIPTAAENGAAARAAIVK